MEEAGNFFLRVFDELWRSLAETFGLFQQDNLAVSSAFADLLTKVIVALIIILIFFWGYKFLRRGVEAIVKRTNLSSDITDPLFDALRYTVILIAALAVMAQFGFSREFLSSAGIAAVFAFAFYLAWLISSKLLTNTMNRYSLDRSLEQLLRNVLGVLIITIGFITVMGQFGINVLSVITTLGVVGIAVGFAAQETLSNFIAGITLLIERPFKIGDWVQLAGQTGRVEEISLRTTRLVTRDNILTSIPNANVASSEIVNLSGGGPLRSKVAVGIAYKESAQQARSVMLPILKAHDRVLQTGRFEPAIRMEELADSSVNLGLFFWIRQNDIGALPAIAADILEQCKVALDEAGIEIPFPHLQLFVDEAKGLEPVLQPFVKRSA